VYKSRSNYVNRGNNFGKTNINWSYDKESAQKINTPQKPLKEIKCKSEGKTFLPSFHVLVKDSVSNSKLYSTVAKRCKRFIGIKGKVEISYSSYNRTRISIAHARSDARNE